MDLGRAPLEGRVLVVALDEGVDRLAQVLDRGEVGAIEVLRATIENQISTWLSQLAWVGSEVEVDVFVPCQPQIPLRLVGLEVAADSGATADGLRLGQPKATRRSPTGVWGNRWNSRPVDSSC